MRELKIEGESSDASLLKLAAVKIAVKSLVLDESDITSSDSETISETESSYCSAVMK